MSKLRKVPKPPAALIKKAKKYHIKVTKKVGRKRVYKRVSLLKKQIKKAIRKLRKSRKVCKSRKVRKVRKVRKSHFGGAQPATYDPMVAKFGYNMPVEQFPGTQSQSSSYVSDLARNSARPTDFQLPVDSVPTYGTYKAFFGQDVPSVPPPRWNFMGQADGTMVAVGSPFYRYDAPSTAFGYRTKSKKCKKVRKSKAKPRRRRYNVEGSACNKLKKRVCQSSPNCAYTKRGCRRRPGVKGGLVFEGPSLPGFGRRYKPRTYRSKCYGKGKSRYCLRLKPKRKDLYYVSHRRKSRFGYDPIKYLGQNIQSSANRIKTLSGNAYRAVVNPFN